MNRDEGLRRAELLLGLVNRHSPELVEEVTGIAAGAGLTVPEVALINSRYELLFLDGSEQPRPGVPGAECTLFGIAGSRTADGTPIIGQNVDLGPESRPLWILLDVRPVDHPRLLTVTLAGMLAQEGINSAGLALCGSMVRSRGWRTGYPSRKYLRRLVLEQSSVAKAVDVIQSAPARASSHNLLLADLTTVVDVETTVSEVHVLQPRDGVIAHANHYLAPGFAAENQTLGNYLPHTVTRCSRMHQLIMEMTVPTTVDQLKVALADHHGGAQAICRHAATDAWASETNVAVISEPAHRRLHVAFGPPCEAVFHTYTLEPETWTDEDPSLRKVVN